MIVTGIFLITLAFIFTFLGVIDNKIYFSQVLPSFGILITFHTISIFLTKRYPVINLVLDFLLALILLPLAGLVGGLLGLLEIQRLALVVLFLNQGIILLRLPFNMFFALRRQNLSQVH